MSPQRMTVNRDRISEQLVLDNLRESLFVVDCEREIVHANERLCEVTGQSRGTLEGSPLEQLTSYVEEGFDSLSEGIDDIIENGIEERRIELVTVHPESAPVPTRLHAEARLARLTDGDDFLGVLVVLRDITARKEAEDELRTNEQQFRTMFESYSAPMLIIDPDSGQITDANRAAVEFYGYTLEELTGMTIQEINCLSPAEVARERERANSQNRNHFEFEHELASGETRPVEVNSSPIDVDGEQLLFSIVHDITERKVSKHELQLFKEAVSQTGHSVLITDAEGVIEYVNPAFEENTGYTSEEAVGRTPNILNSSKQDEEFYAELWETILAGEMWEAELINQRKSGELYYTEQTISPITDDKGEITNFVAIQRDITERKLREKRLSDLNRVLRHNLRNALTAIEGHTQSLLREVTPEQRAQLERVRAQAKSLAETSDKITTVRQALDTEYDADVTCDIGVVLSRLEAELADEYANVIVDIDTESATVELDAETCRTVLTELVDNAIRHNDQETPWVSITVDVPEEPSGHIDVRVLDNGPGIPPQERTAVEVGPQDPLVHSSGVGLAHIHWLVINYGGDVTITDNDPRGSVVTLTLPRTDDTRKQSGPGLGR